MTQAQDRYDAAAQRHSDALQRAITRATSFVALEADKAQLTADLAKAQADYNVLLERTAEYLDASTTALEGAAQIPAAIPATSDPTAAPAAVSTINPAAPQS
ncbi:hypothetical protein EDE12_11233 [Methylosinus sp. sav-2]|uniref:hypothetical protein n=1 Tax=Methylosinus sp. sav-2 TaxID=2485168 RepID=UPI00047CD4ED|nr:hypothetical protein [Methylosinus sp. sav-2]TDX61932.1 hypothetical protein EDE12_11233 [Methylosinus sp. sav-2]